MGGMPEHASAPQAFGRQGPEVQILSPRPGIHNIAILLAPVCSAWSKGLVAGLLSASAYWIVIWAMSNAHMGLVATLRESSVIFAAMLGAIFLKEKVRWPAALVFAGIVLVKAA